MRCAPLSLLTPATAQFKRFFDCGRALRCMLPVASGRFLHLVVLHGYQGADNDAKQLALTEQLSDAALGELGVVALDQPCLLVGTSLWNSPKSLAWQRRLRLGSGLISSPLGHLLVVCRLRLLVSVLGVPLVVIDGISWLDVLLLLLRSSPALSNRIGGSFLI